MPQPSRYRDHGIHAFDGFNLVICTADGEVQKNGGCIKINTTNKSNKLILANDVLQHIALGSGKLDTRFFAKDHAHSKPRARNRDSICTRSRSEAVGICQRQKRVPFCLFGRRNPPCFRPRFTFANEGPLGAASGDQIIQCLRARVRAGEGFGEGTAPSRKITTQPVRPQLARPRPTPGAVADPWTRP